MLHSFHGHSSTPLSLSLIPPIPSVQSPQSLQLAALLLAEETGVGDVGGIGIVIVRLDLVVVEES